MTHRSRRTTEHAIVAVALVLQAACAGTATERSAPPPEAPTPASARTCPTWFAMPELITFRRLSVALDEEERARLDATLDGLAGRTGAFHPFYVIGVSHRTRDGAPAGLGLLRARAVAERIEERLGADAPVTIAGAVTDEDPCAGAPKAPKKCVSRRYRFAQVFVRVARECPADAPPADAARPSPAQLPVLSSPLIEAPEAPPAASTSGGWVRLPALSEHVEGQTELDPAERARLGAALRMLAARSPPTEARVRLIVPRDRRGRPDRTLHDARVDGLRRELVAGLGLPSDAITFEENAPDRGCYEHHRPRLEIWLRVPPRAQPDDALVRSETVPDVRSGCARTSRPERLDGFEPHSPRDAARVVALLEAVESDAVLLRASALYVEPRSRARIVAASAEASYRARRRAMRGAEALIAAGLPPRIPLFVAGDLHPDPDVEHVSVFGTLVSSRAGSTP